VCERDITFFKKCLEEARKMLVKSFMDKLLMMEAVEWVFLFTRKLMKQGLTCPSGDYLISFCTLQCIQLTLSNQIYHVLGEGGRDENRDYKCNAIQALHGVSNLQKYHEASE
jgi:hypothetical protein